MVPPRSNDRNQRINCLVIKFSYLPVSTVKLNLSVDTGFHKKIFQSYPLLSLTPYGAYTCKVLTGSLPAIFLPPKWESIPYLGVGFLLEMLSAVIL